MKEPSPQTKKFFGILIAGISGVALAMGLMLFWDVLPSCLEYRVFSKDLFTACVGSLDSIGGLLYSRNLMRTPESDVS